MGDHMKHQGHTYVIFIEQTWNSHFLTFLYIFIIHTLLYYRKCLKMKMVLEFGAQGGLKLNRNLSCIFIYIFHGLPTFFFSADFMYL